VYRFRRCDANRVNADNGVGIGECGRFRVNSDRYCGYGFTERGVQIGINGDRCDWDGHNNRGDGGFGWCVIGVGGHDSSEHGTDGVDEYSGLGVDWDGIIGYGLAECGDGVSGHGAHKHCANGADGYVTRKGVGGYWLTECGVNGYGLWGFVCDGTEAEGLVNLCCPIELLGLVQEHGAGCG
jgi:hypothetical protein